MFRTSKPPWTATCACWAVESTRSPLNSPAWRISSIWVARCCFMAPNMVVGPSSRWMAAGTDQRAPARKLAFMPGQDDLAGLARFHCGEAFLEVAKIVAMGDHGADVEPRLEHHGHLVPGFVHLAPVDALDGDHVENDDVPVDCDLASGDSEHGDLAAVAHVGEHVAEGV